MRVDHVSYAAEHDGLHATAQRLAKLISVTPVDGGVHPRFGTRNVILPLSNARYVEVVEVLDHPASDKAPFGQAVRTRSENGGGWLGWAVGVDDITIMGRRLGREPADGYRRTPDGRELRWRQLGVKGLMCDPQLPYFVEWADGVRHPSTDGASDVSLSGLTIAGDPMRVRAWLGLPEDYRPSTLEFTFVAPHGTPGLLAVTFDTPEGLVTV
ncbi:MAG: VOC family protein [Candidatus Phosphoribacter sp.]